MLIKKKTPLIELESYGVHPTVSYQPLLPPLPTVLSHHIYHSHVHVPPSYPPTITPCSPVCTISYSPTITPCSPVCTTSYPPTITPCSPVCITSYSPGPCTTYHIILSHIPVHISNRRQPRDHKSEANVNRPPEKISGAA